MRFGVFNLPVDLAAIFIVKNRGLDIVHGHIGLRLKPVNFIFIVRDPLARHKHFSICRPREFNIVMQYGKRNISFVGPATHSTRLNFQSHDFGIQIVTPIFTFRKISRATVIIRPAKGRMFRMTLNIIFQRHRITRIRFQRHIVHQGIIGFGDKQSM